MLRRWLMGGLTIGLLASGLLAKQGAVTTRQGKTFTGDVTEDEKYYYIGTAGGQIKMDKRNVQDVSYTASVDDEYAARHAKLSATDVKGRIELANWANDKQRIDLAITALTEATQIDPANREAALALQSDQRQQDLDLAAKNKKPAAPGTAATGAPKAGTAVSPTSQPAAPPQPMLPRRLLNADEINMIRQKEMTVEDPAIKVRFDNNVVKKYLATGDKDAKAFAALPAPEQALEILTKGDPSMAKDVRIMTDPAPLAMFKNKIQPLIASGCGSTSCHGGMKAGAFGLFTGESVPTVYTNFYILQNFQATIDGAKYQVLDRESPERSLVLQFGLPAAIGTPPHPKVANWKPRFRTENDQAYKDISTWLSKSLSVLQPDYGIRVGFELPTTQAAAPTDSSGK